MHFIALLTWGLLVRCADEYGWVWTYNFELNVMKDKKIKRIQKCWSIDFIKSSFSGFQWNTAHFQWNSLFKWSYPCNNLTDFAYFWKNPEFTEPSQTGESHLRSRGILGAKYALNTNIYIIHSLITRTNFFPYKTALTVLYFPPLFTAHLQSILHRFWLATQFAPFILTMVNVRFISIVFFHSHSLSPVLPYTFIKFHSCQKLLAFDSAKK